MGHLSVRATGPASVEQAWERYAVPALWPTWSPHVKGVDYPHPRLVPGTDGVVNGPLGVRARFSIDVVDEARHRWSGTVRAGPFTVRLVHGVEQSEKPKAAPATTSTPWLQLHGPLPLLLGYAPLARLALSRLLR